jgi:hypothetical protein
MIGGIRKTRRSGIAITFLGAALRLLIEASAHPGRKVRMRALNELGSALWRSVT